MKDEYGRSPLHICAINGDHKCLKFLIKQGIDINAIDNEGNTPLHYAIYGNYMKCIHILVENNCDEEIQNNKK